MNETTSPGQIELRLRARVLELEARLAAVTRCLESAESRAADLLTVTAQADAAMAEAEVATTQLQLVSAQAEAATARADAAEYWLADVTSSAGWRVLSSARAAAGRVRGQLRA